jgi:uncharacterized membrane protein YfcA
MMEISFFNIFQFIVIGIAVGFVGGFLGVGGGAIMIPLLHYWAFPAMHISPEVIVHLSFGTSLAIIIPTSLSSSWGHARAGNVNWRVVFLMAIPGILGSFLGSTLATLLKGPMLRTLFGSLLILLSAQMLLQKKGPEESGKHSFPPSFPTLIIGLMVGVFSGFFALGGGVIAIPLMVRFLSIPIHRAVGISIAFVFFASLVGTGGYIINGFGNPHLPPFALGYVHTIGWVLAGIPSIFLAQWGVRLAQKARPLRLRRVFALVLMIVGIRMLF